MEVAVDVFRFLHFLGLAALVGGTVVQLWKPTQVLTTPMLAGALVQLATGLILLVLTLADANHLKVTIKLVILAPILVLLIAFRKKGLSPTMSSVVLALALVDLALAVFW